MQDEEIIIGISKSMLLFFPFTIFTIFLDQKVANTRSSFRLICIFTMDHVASLTLLNLKTYATSSVLYR